MHNAHKNECFKEQAKEERLSFLFLSLKISRIEKRISFEKPGQRFKKISAGVCCKSDEKVIRYKIDAADKNF